MNSASAPCTNYYRQLQNHSSDNLELSLQDSSGLMHAKSHAFIEDMNIMLATISKRPETEIFRLALCEFEYALLALAQGFYRHAFTSLRLVLELSLSAIYLSAHLIELNEWNGEQYDLSWSTITCRDNGIFSPRFCKAFSPELDSSLHYLTIAKNVYRECSRYVHGNPSSHQKFEDTLNFDAAQFKAWHEKASSVILIISYCFGMRYLELIDITSLIDLEAALLEHVGHIDVFRKKFGGSVEIG